MIELLLEAERALSYGLVDRAETLYRQVAEADPKNSIAVVGLARVALEHDDDAGALAYARKALAIDPENDAARRLVERMTEVLETRGEVDRADGADRAEGSDAGHDGTDPAAASARAGTHGSPTGTCRQADTEADLARPTPPPLSPYRCGMTTHPGDRRCRLCRLGLGRGAGRRRPRGRRPR